MGEPFSNGRNEKKDLDFSSHQSTFQCCGLLFVLVFNIVFSFGAELLSAACHIRCIDAFFFCRAFAFVLAAEALNLARPWGRGIEFLFALNL